MEDKKPKQDYSNLVRLQIPSHPSHCSQVRNFIFQIASDNGFSYYDAADIKLIIGEALYYVLHYAYEDKTTYPVFIEIKLFSDKMEVRIRDFGKKMDENQLKAFDLSDYRYDGLGMYIIQKLADHFYLDTTPDIGNQIIFMKLKG